MIRVQSPLPPYQTNPFRERGKNQRAPPSLYRCHFETAWQWKPIHNWSRDGLNLEPGASSCSALPPPTQLELCSSSSSSVAMQLQQRKGGVGGWGAACRKKKKSELFSRSLEGITLLGYQEAVSKAAAAVWQAGVWIRLPDTSPHRTFSLWFQVDEKSGSPLGDVLRIEAGVFCGATLSVESGGQMDGQTAFDLLRRICSICWNLGSAFINGQDLLLCVYF